MKSAIQVIYNKSLGILLFFALLAIYGSKVSLFIAFFVSLVSLLWRQRSVFFRVIAVFIRPGIRHQESHIYIRIIWMGIHCQHYTLRGAITQKFHIRLVKMVDASAAPGLCITFTILSLTFIWHYHFLSKRPPT